MSIINYIIIYLKKKKMFYKNLKDFNLLFRRLPENGFLDFYD